MIEIEETVRTVKTIRYPANGPTPSDKMLEAEMQLALRNWRMFEARHIENGKIVSRWIKNECN